MVIQWNTGVILMLLKSSYFTLKVDKLYDHIGIALFLFQEIKHGVIFFYIYLLYIHILLYHLSTNMQVVKKKSKFLCMNNNR